MSRALAGAIRRYGSGRVGQSIGVRPDYRDYLQLDKKVFGSPHNTKSTRVDLNQLETKSTGAETPKVRLQMTHFTPEDEFRQQERLDRSEAKLLKTRLMMLERSAGLASLSRARALKAHQNRLKALVTKKPSTKHQMAHFRTMEERVKTNLFEGTSHGDLLAQMPELRQPADSANNIKEFLDRTTLNASREMRNTQGLGRAGARTQRQAEAALAKKAVYTSLFRSDR
ncbi:hypothetical protein DIPPA_13965 [Diplonema papillatum]|nr:hypothetical protein DIPPA_13965 [Diplonema papillatum]